jgi:predicted NBD/HSP70 family sugar kinase
MPREPAARPDAIRRHNLGLLLGQVHRDGVLTRAQLTQRLGLSRSTIGALVADLTELGLLAESVPSGGARAGRPSHVVGPRPDGPYAVAVDVDITHVTAAAVGVGGEVLARHIVATDPSPSPPPVIAQHIVDAVGHLQAQLHPGAWPVGIGVSVPGTVDRRNGTVGFAPNLEWRDEKLGSMLAELAGPGLPVTVGNDADLAVLAEHQRGSGRDCDDLVYLIGRIGVGAGIIVNGLPLRGHDGHAGEIGHNVVDASGPPCHCGKRGCVETYIGEKALLKLAGRRQPPTEERVAALFDEARAGNERAAAAIRSVAEALGRALANVVNVLNPQRLILGGSLSAVFEFAHDEVEQSLGRFAMAGPGHTVQLFQPEFGADSALLGAAELAFEQLLADPVGRGVPLSR